MYSKWSDSLKKRKQKSCSGFFFLFWYKISKSKVDLICNNHTAVTDEEDNTEMSKETTTVWFTGVVNHCTKQESEK